MKLASKMVLKFASNSVFIAPTVIALPKAAPVTAVVAPTPPRTMKPTPPVEIATEVFVGILNSALSDGDAHELELVGKCGANIVSGEGEGPPVNGHVLDVPDHGIDGGLACKCFVVVVVVLEQALLIW